MTSCMNCRKTFAMSAMLARVNIVTDIFFTSMIIGGTFPLSDSLGWDTATSYT